MLDLPLLASAQMLAMSSSSASQRLSRLAPLSEIHERIDALAGPVAPLEVELSAAAGRVLAGDIAIAAPLPRRAAALRDGWAVRADAVSSASSYEPVPLMPPSQWVETGDPMPDGTDAVLPVDAVSVVHKGAEAHAPVAPGEGAIPAGGDAGARHVLRRAGEMLRHADVAVLRSGGVLRATIREPRLRVVLANAAIDQRSDATGPFLLRVIGGSGGHAELIYTSDDPDALEQAPIHNDVDAIITVGGTGTGKRDFAVRTLASLGRVDFHGMAVRPGETAALGAVGSRPVLMLPGRLDAALALWLLVGRRLLARLSGTQVDQISIPVTLARKIVSTIGMTDVVLLSPCEGGVEPIASGHFPLQTVARASGWTIVPPESEGVPAGSTIVMQPLP
jgi:molybdopterin biosynthesis enzyme